VAGPGGGKAGLILPTMEDHVPGRGGTAARGRLSSILRTVWRIPPPRAWPYIPKWCVLGVLIGAVAGVGAIALYGLLQLTTAVLMGAVTGYGQAATAHGGTARPWLLPPLVASGALVASVLVRWLAPEAGGHGTDEAIDAVHHHPRRIRGRVPYVKLLASAITIGSGGSGGTEGPAAQISAAFGSVLSRLFGLSDADARVAVSAGLAAGVGAIFRAPFGGALLGGEIIYRHDSDKAMLLPSMIASTVAYFEFGSVYGFTPMFAHGAAGYRLGPPGDMVLFVLLGSLVGLLGRAYAWSFYRTMAWFSRRRRLPGVLRPAVGGLLVGALGLAVPGALGTGYGTIQLELDRDSLLGMSLWLVVAMPLVKILTTSLSIGSGGSGGLFGPGMVIGAAAGAAVWRLLEPSGLAPGSPAVLVVIGMAACLGAIAHAPVAITVMVVEVTGSADLLAPAMLAVLAAVLVVGDATLYRSQLHSRVQRPGPDHPSPDGSQAPGCALRGGASGSATVSSPPANPRRHGSVAPHATVTPDRE
jgi:chloride channel protein, CIC family